MTPMKKPLEVLRLYAPHDSTLMGVFHSRAKVDPDREFVFLMANLGLGRNLPIVLNARPVFSYPKA